MIDNIEKSIGTFTFNSSLRKLWSFSLFAYIVCNTAFSSKSYLMMLNSYALYFFLGVSLLCILCSGHIKINLYVISMAVFFIVSIIGLLYTTSGYAQTFMYDLFVVICILFCMVNFINSTDDIHFMFQALMVGGFVLDLYIIYLYGGNFIDAIFNDTRVGELAGNANEVGIKSCYASCIALFFVINEKQPKIQKAIYSIICLVCAFFSVITASRKVLLLLLLGFLFLLLFRENKSLNAIKLVRNICFAFGAILFIIFLVYNIDAFSLLRIRIDEFFSLLQTGGGNHGDKNRIMFFQEGWRVFLEHPFWGDGTACSDVYFGTYSHCNYIEILMSNGVLGFLVFYFSYPIIFFRLLSRRKYVFLRKSTLGPHSKISMDILCLFVFISMLLLSFGLVYIKFIYCQVLVLVVASYAFQKYDCNIDAFVM